MNEPTHFDLVAIGGGFAGLCAGVRSPELGLRTAVLEADADESYPCSSRWAGGIFHVSYHDVRLSPDELIARPDHDRSGDARCRPECLYQARRKTGRQARQCRDRDDPNGQGSMEGTEPAEIVEACRIALRAGGLRWDTDALR
jgi:glycine/D-amino acid oxidase-like deaminating enzyme